MCVENASNYHSLYKRSYFSFKWCFEGSQSGKKLWDFLRGKSPVIWWRAPYRHSVEIWFWSHDGYDEGISSCDQIESLDGIDSNANDQHWLTQWGLLLKHRYFTTSKSAGLGQRISRTSLLLSWENHGLISNEKAINWPSGKRTPLYDLRIVNFSFQAVKIKDR